MSLMWGTQYGDGGRQVPSPSGGGSESREYQGMRAGMREDVERGGGKHREESDDEGGEREGGKPADSLSSRGMYGGAVPEIAVGGEMV